jgi:predicted O-methyltransferase YrrM
MNQELWTSVDQYFCDLLIPADPVLDHALKSSAAAGLPPINVAPNQGKFLYLLARIRGCKKILEIGTLGGYSTIWLARALPADGRLVTLEFDPKHAAVARENFNRAGLAGRIDLRVGRAIEHLPKLASENAAPFDLIFIDADKQSTADYFSWALKLSRPGTVIIVDNVVRDGNVIDAKTTDESIQGIRRFAAMLARETRVSATAIQTLGTKGYDGFAIAIVNSPAIRI